MPWNEKADLSEMVQTEDVVADAHVYYGYYYY